MIEGIISLSILAYCFFPFVLHALIYEKLRKRKNGYYWLRMSMPLLVFFISIVLAFEAIALKLIYDGFSAYMIPNIIIGVISVLLAILIVRYLIVSTRSSLLFDESEILVYTSNKNIIKYPWKAIRDLKFDDGIVTIKFFGSREELKISKYYVGFKQFYNFINEYSDFRFT